MATSVSTTVQAPVGRSVRAPTLRRCGRCRCPGHTRGRCPVFMPVGTHYMEFGGIEAEQAAVQRNALAELSRISVIGNRPMTRYECMHAWCASRRGDAQRLNPGELERLSGRQRAAREELDAALAHRSTVPVENVAMRELNGLERQLALLRNQLPQYRVAPVHTPPLLPTRAPPAPVPAPPTVSPPSAPKVLDKPIEETTCAICLDDLTECNKFITPCGHQFHAGCILKCMATTRKAECPTCRTKVM